MARNLTTLKFETLFFNREESTGFEHSVREDVFPAATGVPSTDGLFIRNLYRLEKRTGTIYVCTVESLFPSDGGFYGMYGPLRKMGALISQPPRYWPLYESRPDADAAARAERTESQIRMTLLRLEFDKDQREFEQALARTAAAEAGSAGTARWFRDDDTSLGAVEYLFVVTGPALRTASGQGAAEPLRNAGGRLLESEVYTCVGSFSGS